MANQEISPIYDVPAREFIAAWQSSHSVSEVGRKIGFPNVDNQILSSRATSFRQNGVPLKKMVRSGHDYALLARFAELAEEKVKEGVTDKESLLRAFDEQNGSGGW